MKTKLLIAVIAVAGIAVGLHWKDRVAARIATLMVRDTLEQRQHEQVLAVFEQAGSPHPNEAPSIEHYALRLGALAWRRRPEPPGGEASLPSNLLLTVELWGSPLHLSESKGGLGQLSAGELDDDIDWICRRFLGPNPAAYVRLNPDMEVPVDRFPWQNRPAEYIPAFRYFAETIRACAPKAQIVWGPAGYPGVLEFWPGAAYVDAVSITLDSNSESLSEAYPKPATVHEELRRKLHRLRFISKPVLILGSQALRTQGFQAEPALDAISAERKQLAAIYGPAVISEPITMVDEPQRGPVRLGLYDPNQFLTDEPAINIEHIFTDFDDVADGTLETALHGVVERGHDVIISMEPKHRDGTPTDPAVLDHVVSGRHDGVLRKLHSLVAAAGSRVYLRFAHEMEIPITRYPWQSRDPVTYIKAFRHFMNLGEETATNVVRVWGPAGDRGSLEWWPGKDVVDAISIAIYGLPDKDITDPNQQESFAKIFFRKVHRMRFVSKPIFITEFGVKGSEDFQDAWLAGAAEVLGGAEAVIGVNYFNMSDTPKAWGEAIKPPDWSITRDSLRRFAALLAKHREATGGN